MGLRGLFFGLRRLILGLRGLIMGLRGLSFGPERADFGFERADFGLERADLGPERGRGGTYGRTDVWKFTPVSYRTLALRGHCPKRVIKILVCTFCMQNFMLIGLFV